MLQEVSMRNIRAIFVIALLSAVAAFGQDRTVWRTSADVQEGGRGSLTGPVGAPQTGVGQTRSPNSISTPTASGTTPSGATPNRLGRIEGVLQQVNAESGRLVVVTDQRDVLTVRTPQGTPVRYHGDTYRV